VCSVSVYFVWFVQKSVLVSLSKINQLIFIMDAGLAYYGVEIEFICAK